MIGAAAMAARGVGRSTLHVDLLTLSAVGFEQAWWTPLSRAGVNVSVSRGDADDPLAGVVRFEQTDREALIAAVAADLNDLPPQCRRFWSRIIDAHP